MTRSVRVALAAGALSAGMIIGLGAGTAGADSSTRSGTKGATRTATARVELAPLPPSEKESILPPHMQHQLNNPNYNKKWFNLLQHSIDH